MAVVAIGAVVMAAVVIAIAFTAVSVAAAVTVHCFHELF